MVFDQNALKKIVKAARMADRFARDMQCVLLEKGTWTVPDEISGQLLSALYCISGERQGVSEDFMDSRVMKLVRSDLSDENVMREIIRMSDTRMPEPNLISKSSMREMYEKNGGYMSPEGEWK